MLKKIFSNPIRKLFSNGARILSFLPHILALLFILAFAAFAWQEPSQTPPSGNVPAPINVGATDQSKLGGFGLGGGAGQALQWFKNIAGTLQIQNQGGTPNLVIGQDGKVGLGTTNPGVKLDVIGGDIRTDKEFKTGQNEGDCPIWKDCDGDGKTGGSGDCDEGCSQCYVGSTGGGSTPDGRDNNCNGVVDELEYLNYSIWGFPGGYEEEINCNIFGPNNYFNGTKGSTPSETFCNQFDISGVQDCRARQRSGGCCWGANCSRLGTCHGLTWRSWYLPDEGGGCGGGYGTYFNDIVGYCECSYATYR